MDEYRIILKRVGTFLVIVGVIDIGYMVYRIANMRHYSSSFNVFALIAGIFLIRGSLWATRIITSFSSFLLGGCLGAVIFLLPFLFPFDLWVTMFRLNPGGSIFNVLFAIVSLALLFWVNGQLRSPSIVQAREAAGQIAKSPRSLFGFGVLLAVALSVILHLSMGGEFAAKAEQLAQAKVGPGYKFTVTSMNRNIGNCRAVVTAYNQKEIKDVIVEWQQ
jgi:hypothetical protein